MNGLLPFRPAHALIAVAEDRRWLIDGLWAAEAVGIVGGEPKCCKSFLALDMAVAVASGAPCLGRFAPVEPAGVLLFAAEDALHVVRRRLEGIAFGAGTTLDALDIQVITAPTLRLDLVEDRQRLAETVEHPRPRLLILDLFVRLHRIDENVSGEVAPLLAYLRELQRRHAVAVAVVLVHTKNVCLALPTSLPRAAYARPLPATSWPRAEAGHSRSLSRDPYSVRERETGNPSNSALTLTATTLKTSRCCHVGGSSSAPSVGLGASAGSAKTTSTSPTPARRCDLRLHDRPHASPSR
jgi:hypothetical protein